MDIFFFSGTGNSLHAARELQRRFPGARLIPMVRQMHESAPAVESEEIGFVFPIHLTDMPYPVRDFVTKLNINKARYIFVAATRISTYYIADIQLNRILKKKGKSLDAFFIMNMARNSPCGLVPKSFPGFKKMTASWTASFAPEKLDAMESVVLKKLDFIRESVGSRSRHWDGRNVFSLAGKHLNRLLMAPFQSSSPKQVIPFYTDADCTGCGICEQVCLSGRVTMTNGRPVWQTEVPCWFCYACFNSCPEQAILIRNKYDRKTGRYLHPDITAADIAAQKQF